jgi:hypothetical protein
MRLIPLCVAGIVLAVTSSAHAAQISGEYLEARTCDVYTGPCFANAEMDLAGKEAVMAWKVEEGGWNGVSLEGLGVAIVVTSEKTMGASQFFKMHAGKMSSIILVDNRATEAQRDALVAFAKHSAKDFTGDVKKIVSAPITLENDHLAGKGTFSAGDVAKIETRGLKKGDCVCSNEQVFYEPLTKVADISPAYANTLSYTGKDFDRTWTTHGQRSAFLATFRR